MICDKTVCAQYILLYYVHYIVLLLVPKYTCNLYSALFIHCLFFFFVRFNIEFDGFDVVVTVCISRVYTVPLECEIS